MRGGFGLSKALLGVAAAGMIAGFATAPGPAQAEQVATQPAETASLKPAQAEALELRHLQTELMVAALSCGPASRAGYNQFVSRYQKRLVAGGRNLRKLFSETHGRAAQRRLDAFVTRLANESSRLSLTDQKAFCARTADAVQALLTGGSKALDRQRALYRCRMEAGRANCSVITGQMTAAGGPEIN